MNKGIEKCNKTSKECGYLNFASYVLDLMKNMELKMLFR